MFALAKALEAFLASLEAAQILPLAVRRLRRSHDRGHTEVGLSNRLFKRVRTNQRVCTGLANPKKTTNPSPSKEVERALSGTIEAWSGKSHYWQPRRYRPGSTPTSFMICGPPMLRTARFPPKVYLGEIQTARSGGFLDCLWLNTRLRFWALLCSPPMYP
jgi:hypothetical protein